MKGCVHYAWREDYHKSSSPKKQEFLIICITNMKKKDVRPPYETLVKIADALGVSVSVLLDEIAAYPSEPIINMPIIGSVRAGMDGNIVSDAKRRVARTRANCSVGLLGDFLPAVTAKDPLK